MNNLTTFFKGKIKFLLSVLFKDVYRKFFLNEIKLNDIQASISLSAVGVGFLPQSSYAISPTLMLHVLNDITINQRKSIAEFGSGVSTIYMAKVIKDKKLDAKIYSIDEDMQWQNVIKNELKERCCDDVVEFITAPINSGNGYSWFDEEIINEALLSNKRCTFDCVLVDAPSTHNNKTIRARAVPFIKSKNYLASEFSIFVDDTYRMAEYNCAKEWNKSLKHSQIEDYETYTVITCGTQYVSRPVYHGHRYKLSEYIGLEKI